MQFDNTGHDLDNGNCRQAIYMFTKFCRLFTVLLMLDAAAGCLPTINAITPSNTYHKVADLDYDKTSHTTLIGAISWPLRGLAPVLDAVDRFVSSNGGRSRLR